MEKDPSGNLLPQTERTHLLVAPIAAEWLYSASRYLAAVGLAGLSIGLLWAILGALLAGLGLDAGRDLWWQAGLAIALVGGVLLIELAGYYDRELA